MSAAAIAAMLWLVAANLIAMLPSKRHHWPAACGLITIALPIVAWLWVSVAAWAALLFVVAAGSVLRYPVFYAALWLRGLLR